MTPQLKGFDHSHLNVTDRAEAERWYANVLGFNRVERLMAWATANGPLTVENPEGTIHLALFEKDGPPSESSMAYCTDGESFLAWKAHLEGKGAALRLADHDLAYSLYFSDPWGNGHEITTYERDYVAQRIKR